MGRSKSLLGALTMLVGLGCAAQPTPETSAPEVPQAYAFTPSPLLDLARSEREVPTMGLRAKRGAGAPAESAQDTTLDEDGISRTVRVPKFRFPTPEDLTRAALRDAESRRPRELHPARYLLRTVRVHAPTRAAKRRARLRVDARDPQIAQCLTQDLTAHPSVIIRTPAALVVEEARRTGAGPTDHRLSIQFNGRRPPTVTATPPVHDAAQKCLVAAVTPRPGDRPRFARVELSAFVQGAYGHGKSGPHQALANEAATLGWIELERGASEEALAYFQDAFWLYHRAEYLLLQAMALHQMGKVNMAVTRYRRFIKARPHAPETPMVRERIAELTGAPSGE